MNEQLKDKCDRLRKRLLEIEVDLRDLKKDIQDASDTHDHGECIAQSMLAVRATEEARMRVGKVLQYNRDGVSIYDSK